MIRRAISETTAKRAHATGRFVNCNLDAQALPRLVIGTIIPQEASTLASRTAVRKGSEVRMKPKEKYIR